ncbi:hypothetical protein HC341_08485 [Aquisalimonas sp. 2447]|uniref:restriction endonuclease subunit S n=1 Tax=Aquisalimonas sp. 2447 TaxID=2740807 RepID=UPI0014327203|nr:hypothetical protein [Aquisalimonas sp. 2447]QIT55239.1 hypothetical protein HC341_08485 [Aquisalimonas sp. 2447]
MRSQNPLHLILESKGFPEANCHALIVVSPIRRFVSGPWLAWVLNSDYGYNSLLSIKTGALHPHLNCGYLKDLYAPVPPVEEQNEIVRYILIKKSEVDELVLEAHKGISLLKERRSALISAAVTGKIDVRGWEPPVPHTESPRRAATELPV